VLDLIDRNRECDRNNLCDHRSQASVKFPPNMLVPQWLEPTFLSHDVAAM
jgi:hypothetical protein